MTIYLDHAATAPINDAAIDALNTQMRKLGNPSSTHNSGRSVRKDVEDARHKLAQLLGANPSEIIFTGSGTEADNLAIKGFFWQFPERNVIVTSAFEHHAILDPVEWLVAHEGAEEIRLPITKFGTIDLEFLAKVVKERGAEIALISVMHSNNEIGSLQPISEVVRIAGEIPVHTDAVQSFSKVEFNFAELGVSAASISAHKVGGPHGIAALILKHGLDLTPILHGGGQEREIRSGTLNAPAIVAFTAAAEYAIANRDHNFKKVRELRDYFISELRQTLPDVVINSALDPALPGIVNASFPGTESDALLLLLDGEGVSASAGSACNAGVPRPSHVLLALGLSESQAYSSLRLSIGISNTKEEIDQVITVMPSVVERARNAFVVSELV
jgi:cysteine desulfurase|tara:strand:- start:3203 stop:4363 length:1161 start_codon:yes stop_codon:yes gene_type:complete